MKLLIINNSALFAKLELDITSQMPHVENFEPSQTN
jgi:hypothetical protein